MSIIPTLALFVGWTLLVIISLAIIVIFSVVAHNTSPSYNDSLLYHSYFAHSISNRQYSIFKVQIAARRIELRQSKPCQCISKLQLLLCKGFTVSNNAVTIHISPIDRNYCSSTRLSGDKYKHARKASNFR